MTRKARTKFTFDAQGRLTAETDLNGYVTCITYPSATSRVITDPAGRTLTLRLANGRITSASDSATPRRTVTYGYDGNGDLTDITDVGSGVTHFTVRRGPSDDRMTTVRAPGETAVMTNTYDGSGRVISQTDRLSRETTFDYTSIEDATMRRSSLTRRATCGSTAIRPAAGSPPPTATGPLRLRRRASTRRGHVRADRRLRRARRLRHVHLRRGRQRAHAQGPDGPQDDEDLRPTTRRPTSSPARNPKGVRTTFTYDANGNMMTQSTPLRDCATPPARRWGRSSPASTTAAPRRSTPVT